MHERTGPGLPGRVSDHMERKCAGGKYPAGIKWTRQRKAVYEVLEQAGEPLNAVQIYQRVCESEKDATYAVSTIYRILAAFEEKALISRTTWMGDGTVVYELNRGEHTHYAVCLECHRRIPLSCCPFAGIHLEEEAHGFTVTGHKLELYGYCRQCGQALHGQQNSDLQ